MRGRHDQSYKIHASQSYSLSRDTTDDENYQSFSGMVVTVHGIVSVHSTHWIDGRHQSSRGFSMAFRGRMYHRSESGAWLVSAKQGAVLAGKFARDVAEGRVKSMTRSPAKRE